MRSDEEVVARVKLLNKSDLLGFEVQCLVPTLPFKHAQPFLKADVTEANWQSTPRDRDTIIGYMRDYMVFALEKAQNHRGISASRSVSHFRAWVWLLGDEDFNAINWDQYPQYGVPILAAICKRFGFEFPSDSDMQNMARGELCSPDCTGCGQ